VLLLQVLQHSCLCLTPRALASILDWSVSSCACLCVLAASFHSGAAYSSAGRTHDLYSVSILSALAPHVA